MTCYCGCKKFKKLKCADYVLWICQNCGQPYRMDDRKRERDEERHKKDPKKGYK